MGSWNSMKKIYLKFYEKKSMIRELCACYVTDADREQNIYKSFLKLCKTRYVDVDFWKRSFYCDIKRGQSNKKHKYLKQKFSRKVSNIKKMKI